MILIERFVFANQDADLIEYVKVYPEIVNVPDPEVLEENPVENKHHKLTRSVRSGTMSRDLKPNASIRDQLNVSFASFSIFSAVAFFQYDRDKRFSG